MVSLGVFGGTFDPPHIAHLILASEAQAQLSLDRVLWVLTPVPPHKPCKTPMAIRRELVEAAISNNHFFNFSDVDISRDPPHYAIDTMLLLKQRYPDATLTYLMGADSLRDLSKWHQPELFIERCDRLGVMRRLGADIDIVRLKTSFPGIENKLSFIDITRFEISSNDIQKRVAQGRSYRYFLSEKVYRLVLKYHLYQD